MRALLGIVGLLIFIYLRPHEWWKELANVPMLYIFLGITLVGLGADIAARETTFVVGPQLGWAVMFVTWCSLSLLLKIPDQAGAKLPLLFICFLLYFLIAHGLQRVKSLSRVTLVIFASGLFVAFCCVYQAFSPYECVTVDLKNRSGHGFTRHVKCNVNEDKTPSEGITECISKGRPGVTYRCERWGLFDTSSIGGGRVRYLGVLMDPNECALATVLAVPFAFSYFERKKTLGRLLLLLFALGLIGVAVVFTKSRGGQLVFATALGAYFVRKFGYRRGIMVAAVMTVPAIALGGRGGEEADQSTIDRLQAAAAAIKMMMAGPLLGAGFTQFTEHHHLTAHNAYLLAVGETGFPGMVLFVCNIVLAIKVPIAVLRRDLPPTEDMKTAQSLAMALLATFCGMALGIFFLSWTYHYVLWIHFGLAGSLYSVIRAKDKKFKVSLSLKEFGLIVLGCIAVLVLMTFQIKRKNCW
ncbi:MAG: O-antigen ligase family protein [Byssovorax sp.]